MARKFYPGIKGKIVVEDYLNVRRKVGKGDFEKVEGDRLSGGVDCQQLVGQNL